MVATVFNTVLGLLPTPLQVAAVVPLVLACVSAVGYVTTKNEREKAAHGEAALFRFLGAGVLLAAPVWVPLVRAAIPGA